MNETNLSSRSPEHGGRGVRKFFASQRPFLLLALGIYFFLGLSTLSNFITADEHFWLPNQGADRIREYWGAVAERDWEDTRINDKPGVTLAYFSGIALPFSGDLVDRQLAQDDDSPIKEFEPDVVRRVNFLFRLPILVFIGLFSFYFVWIIRKITRSERTAIWAVILMYLSPTLLGISQIVNPDTLFWVFGLASLLTFFALLETGERKLTFLSGLFLGLTLASKYVGVIFFPFFLVMIAVRYLFRAEHFSGDRSAFRRALLGDFGRYWSVLGMSVAVFAFLMPAAIVEPEVLFESTVGFQGMLPIFLAIVGFTVLSLLDLLASGGRTLFFVTRTLSRAVPYLEKALYALLLASVLFVFFNWLSHNSLHDLSHIPFDAKTKETFTTENPWIDRYIAEHVPLVFSLTPIALSLLVLSLLHSLLSSFRHRCFAFTIALFFPIFYVAVIEQGLLVTARYSIILFPLSFILGAMFLDEILRKAERLRGRYIALSAFVAIAIAAGGAMVLVPFHNESSFHVRKLIEHVIGYYFIPLFLLAPLVILGLSYGLVRGGEALMRRFRLRVPASFVSLVVIGVSLVSLLAIRPHYFVYTNVFLPDRYLLSTPWGYGGYEAAQYLNALPDAEHLTVWADMYGMCEFFEGKCIRKQKLRPDQYLTIDYFYRTLNGAISPQFPHELGEQVFRMSIGGQPGNFVKLIENTYVEADVE
jgi:hypothetical protein